MAREGRAMRRAAMAWVVAGALVAAPASAETVRVAGVYAANAREASLLPTIGVDLLGGPAGEALGEAIERKLARLGGDGVRHARLVAPTLRPDGLLSGQAGFSASDYPYVETRDRCVEKDAKGKCTRRERYRVRCIRRTVDFHADLRMVRWRDGRTVYAAPKTRNDSDWWCEDSGFPTSVDTSVQMMVESVAQEVRMDLAPHAEDYTIRVKEDRNGLSPDDADRFRAAVRLTKRDQAAACAAFAALGQSAPDHGPTLFNRALCAEAAGRYAEANDLYTRARVFGPQYGGDISRGLARVASLAAGAEDERQMAAL
ncbi:hypothetical protein GCM10011380_05560 [Sphingomonas metalli]|uniref:Tetratricopeptide repeat protein n=1 Tax=Sphingomonas metalli TaxID=1779358 RepID=A0A916SXQ0_9SPHN|nr:hypothetical protein [Sphingomonas metalli]GGB18888.1 hypothetical protein GCM10011380_05560 [Sphingomonas metalli]